MKKQELIISIILSLIVGFVIGSINGTWEMVGNRAKINIPLKTTVNDITIKLEEITKNKDLNELDQIVKNLKTDYHNDISYDSTPESISKFIQEFNSKFESNND